jgi:hypothetical protein
LQDAAKKSRSYNGNSSGIEARSLAHCRCRFQLHQKSGRSYLIAGEPLSSAL